MFRRMHEAGGDGATGAAVRFTFDGRDLEAREGDTVAAALLASGIARFRRTPVSGSPRGPYCMMGVCFECLVIIDGVGNRQGCMVRVEEGLRIETQNGGRAFSPGSESAEDEPA